LKGGKASVIKDAGDDPDVTHGTTVFAEVEVQKDAAVIITAE